MRRDIGNRPIVSAEREITIPPEQQGTDELPFHKRFALGAVKAFKRTLYTVFGLGLTAAVAHVSFGAHKMAEGPIKNGDELFGIMNQVQAMKDYGETQRTIVTSSGEKLICNMLPNSNQAECFSKSDPLNDAYDRKTVIRGSNAAVDRSGAPLTPKG